MTLGHERQVKYLESVFRRGKFSHAYLFYGPAHVGKYTLAQEIAKSFHCQNYRSPTSIVLVGEACGECRECALIEAGTHPHVVILDTAHTLLSKKEARKDIPIEDIRELKRIFSLAPEGTKWRIAIINDAEKMSDAAANAFLKILEEPGPQTLFLLISSSPELIPETIRSRTNLLRFSLVPDSMLRVYGEQKAMGSESVDLALSIAAGRPGIFCEFLRDPEYMDREKKFLGAVVNFFKKGSAPEALRLAEKVSQSDELRKKTVEYILRMIRARIMGCLDDAAAVHRAVASLKRVDEIATKLEVTNVNPRLAMDVILLETLSVLS